MQTEDLLEHLRARHDRLAGELDMQLIRRAQQWLNAPKGGLCQAGRCDERAKKFPCGYYCLECYIARKNCDEPGCYHPRLMNHTKQALKANKCYHHYSQGEYNEQELHDAELARLTDLHCPIDEEAFSHV